MKHYSLDKVSTNPHTLSRLRFKRPNKEDVIIPFLDEIVRVIEQQHMGYSQSCKKHYGQKITNHNSHKLDYTGQK